MVENISSFLVHLEHSLLVELVDLRPVELLGLVALYLHRVGQYSSVDEGLGLKVDILGLFEALQFAVLAYLGQILDELASDRLISAKFLVVALDLEIRCELLDELAVRDSDGNDEGFCGVSMDEDLCEFVALHVYVFHFFSSNVLALLQFEDVLLTIDDANCSGLCAHRSYIAGLQPSVSSDCIPGLLLIVVVSQENAWSSCPNFTSRCGKSVLINISGEIVHFWDVD